MAKNELIVIILFNISLVFSSIITISSIFFLLFKRAEWFVNFICDISKSINDKIEERKYNKLITEDKRQKKKGKYLSQNKNNDMELFPIEQYILEKIEN